MKKIKKSEDGFHVVEMLIAVVVIVGVAIVGYKVLRNSHAAPVPVVSSCPSLNSYTPVNSVKPEAKGLMDQAIASTDSGYAGGVITVSWSDIEPSQGNFSFCTINKQLNAIAAYDQSVSASQRVYAKLRVQGGFNAPQWVDSLDGGAVTGFVNDKSNATGSVPRFWDSDVIAAWRELVRNLANSYNNYPYLVDFDAGGLCVTATNEPMVRDNDIASNDNKLLTDGYTMTNDANCQEQQLKIAANYFTDLNISESFSAYQDVSSDSTINGQNSSSQTISFINEGLSLMSTRFVPGNNELGRVNGTQPGQSGYYNYQVDNYLLTGLPSGNKTYFQTANPSNLIPQYASTTAAADSLIAKNVNSVFKQNTSYVEILPDTYAGAIGKINTSLY